MPFLFADLTTSPLLDAFFHGFSEISFLERRLKSLEEEVQKLEEEQQLDLTL